MFDKLEAVEKRYEELTKMIADPELIANQTEWQKAIKEHASIEEVVAKFREYKKVKKAMEEAQKPLYEMSAAAYQQAQAAGAGAEANAQGGAEQAKKDDDDVVDAEYTEVKDDKK